MAKKESNFKNMALTLFAVTLIASTALGLVYKATKQPIEAAKLAIKLAAIKDVVPQFDNNPSGEEITVSKDGDSVRVYPAKLNNKIVGAAVETFTNKGFAGNIKLMVGFLPDGTINNVSVLEHKETPGLGDKMGIWFNDSIKHKKSCVLGKNPKDYKLKVSKDGGDVDAITAATISSRAFCDAVQRAYDVQKKLNFNPTETGDSIK